MFYPLVPFVAAVIAVLMFFQSHWESSRFEREVLLARDVAKACMVASRPPSEALCSQARKVMQYGPDIPHKAIQDLETCDARTVDASPVSEPFAKLCDSARRTVADVMVRATSVGPVGSEERIGSAEKPIGLSLVAINVAVTLVTLLIGLGLASVVRRKRASA